MVDHSSPKTPLLRWEHNSVVGQSYVRIFFALILSCYSYLGHTYQWVGNPPILLFHVSITYLVLMSIFLLIAGFTRSMSWPYIIIGLLFDVSFSTYAMYEGGVSTFYLYGIYLWIIIGYGLRFGRKYMLIANVLTIIGFSVVLTHADFWKDYTFVGWGLMLWIVLMPIYIGKLLSKLEAAVKIADKANKAKSEFLANMSHEIRTPLTAVIGFSEAALDDDQTTEQHLFALNTIHSSSRHLLNLINNILDFSKIDAGELEIEHVKMSPVQVISEVESIIMIQAQKKSLNFELNYRPPLPATIESDPIRLKQVLINLCSNAIKFTEQGTVRVDVDYDAPTNIMNVTVTDTGIGMTYEQSQKVFQPFKQADSSTTRKFGGTGLGLSLSKQLADLLNYNLTVYSEPDVGTTFKLQIPCGKICEQEMICGQVDTPDNPKTNSNKSPSSYLEKRADEMPLLCGDILLAEDTEMNQLLINKYLTKMGANVTLANNGREALEQARKKEFDLIYMDMQMPIMSGIEAIQTLREEGYSKPIVVLTANATHNDRKSCANAGSDDFLTKPIIRNTLYNMTSRYLPEADDTEKDIRQDGKA